MIRCNNIFSNTFYCVFLTGRAAYPDSLICGKVIQFWGGMFFPLLGKEVKNESFEILVADDPKVFKWVKSSGGNYC